MLKRYPKDPNSTVDFLFDFASSRNGNGYSDYLDYGETISSAVAISSNSSELIINSTDKTNNDTAVKVWVSGGVVGSSYTLTVRITTSSARVDDRSITIYIDNL